MNDAIDAKRHEFAQRLQEHVEPKIQWCGTEHCLHRQYEHGLNNRCLVCSCEGFSSRPDWQDIATALRFAER